MLVMCPADNSVLYNCSFLMHYSTWAEIARPRDIAISLEINNDK